MARNILILGATGRIGSIVLKDLRGAQGIAIRVYVRTPSKLSDTDGIDVVKGDLLDTPQLKEAMKDMDMVLAAVDGDLYEQAKSITTAVRDTSVKRIVWVTGMGIHHEVPGLTGKMLDLLVKSQPQYVEAADMIADCGVDYTLVRAAHLTDGQNEKYHLQKEGEKLHRNTTDRAAVARFMADMAINPAIGKNESIGVTN